MIKAYYWNSYTDKEIYIDSSAFHNLSDLCTLCTSLSVYNQYIIGINEQGIIVRETFFGDSDLEFFNKKLEELNLSQQSKDIFYTTSLSEFKNKLDEFFANNSSNEKIVGEDLFILYDFLPDELKKELKIYIKKS